MKGREVFMNIKKTSIQWNQIGKSYFVSILLELGTGENDRKKFWNKKGTPDKLMTGVGPTILSMEMLINYIAVIEKSQRLHDKNWQ